MNDPYSPIEATPEQQAAYAEHTVETEQGAIARLAKLTLMEYDRVRSEESAKLKCRPTTLDAMIKSERNKVSESKRLPFNEVEPSAEEINPAELLNEIARTVKRFIVLDDHQADAAALWTAYTWFVDVAEIVPIAIADAPEKSCGKSQLLTVFGRMSYRPLSASNASPSALFRAVEQWRPTILIDEADTFFRDNHEMHGLINAGYSRDGYVLRSEAVGDSFEPRRFSVFSPKAIAGIALEKHLPDATMSRGIVFNLRRKLPHESVERLRHSDRDTFNIITGKLARFAQDYSIQVQKARPTLPDELSDRQQDNWEGLFAVASCAGEEWIERARKAALALSCSNKSVSTGNELLSDIKSIFITTERISTEDLITELCRDQEAPWATYNKGRPISGRQLARQLKPYGVFSKDIKFSYGKTLKGYTCEMFNDAFERYLTPTPEFIHDPQLLNKDKAYKVADNKSPSATIRNPQPHCNDTTSCVADLSATRNLSATLKPLPALESCPLADKTHQRGEVNGEDKSTFVRI